MSDAPGSVDGIRAQARIHHMYFLGLQLMVATRKGSEVMGEWMYRLFRRQHHEKFLSSFEKLGLEGLPDAVACAKYHVLSNSIGGVGVEYMYEHDRKAWVRFRYPRWMYDGPALCGIPVEASRGFLNGWYAHNGVSLGNPRLGFVCVSEDMTGEFGFCGYFREFERDLSPDERLTFAKDEVPPPFDEQAQPCPPEGQWNEERLEKANRNYALEYIRNGLVELSAIVGEDETSKLGGLAARLIGLQHFSETARMVGVVEDDEDACATYLRRMLEGMGDTVELTSSLDGFTIEHRGLRAVRGLDDPERGLVLGCWMELWRGALQSLRERRDIDVDIQSDGLRWSVRRC